MNKAKQGHPRDPRVTFPCGYWRETFRDCPRFAPDDTMGDQYCTHIIGGALTGECTLPKVVAVVYAVGNETKAFIPASARKDI